VIVTAADGTRLHYTIEGRGVPIVLVGGKTSNIDGAWWRYIPQLAKRFKVIALDNRGSGQSDKPKMPFTTELMAQDALAVLHAAGERSAHWFGISLGGMILERLALDHSEAVRSLILGATSCGGERPAVAGPLPTELVENPLRRYANLYEPRFILEHADWVEDDARRFGKLPLHAIVSQDQAVAQHNVCERLAEIRQPVLVLHGRQDQMVPLSRGEALAAGLPNARLRILDPAGHQFHSEQFATVLPLVIDFVDEVERQRS
jgi:pimeloyl-ACP methyl ester carboxylesterase